MIKKMLKALRYIFYVMLIIIILMSITAQVRRNIEKDDVKPCGTFVQVDNKKMHVYTIGNGTHTIVLMPGLGSIAPTIDFKPLIEKLKKDYKVVVIEPFGYGFSDETEKRRSAENIVNEMRTALKKVHINGPYILMPHSVSGVYAQYYACEYSDEVEAIVMLDSTLVNSITEHSDEVDKSLGKKTYILASAGNITGLDRLYYKSIYKNENCFSDEDKESLIKMGVQNTFNKTMKNEYDMMIENCRAVSKLNMPSDIHILKFIAVKSMKDVNNKKYRDIINKNISEFKGYKNFRYKLLQGNHYIYYSKCSNIADETKAFINKNNSSK